MDKDAFYFPHFCNARHDRKIRRMRKELGVEGYGLFFMVLEVLRDQIDFKYPLEDIDLLAEEFGTSEVKLQAVIQKYDLFYVDAEGLFFSPKLIVYLQPYLRMKEQRRIAGLASAQARQAKLLTLEEKKQRPLNEIEQNKVNKVNKLNTYSAFFESVWKLYPNKKGKAQISDTTKKKLEKVGYETLEKCIKRYTETKEDWKKWQNGSTFFNGGYVDYLDENFQERVEVSIYREE